MIAIIPFLAQQKDSAELYSSFSIFDIRVCFEIK